MHKTLLASVRRSAGASLGIVLGYSMMAAIALPAAQAQSYTPQPLQDFQTKDAGSGLFNSRDASSSTSGLMNLIHNAIQGNSRSSDDYASEQEANLTDAAAQFRAKQAERLRLQRQTPAASETPALATPTN